MNGKYIMAMDEGTSSTRCILFDRTGKVCAIEQKEFRQIYPKPGWVEHDAGEIFSSMIEVSRKAMAKISAKASDIAGIGITNQRETTVIWDKTTGEPIANAIVWQCRRTSDTVDDLVARGYGETVQKKTGLVPDAYFSGTKIRWLLDNVPGARARAERGELLFGTIETWLIWKLTGGKVHVTDVSNASRTMLFNIHTLTFDPELLSMLDIPSSLLPEVRSSSEVYGVTDSSFFGGEIPISGAAGDQQCALFGQCCFQPGEMKNTYGTGCFLLMNTGATPIQSRHGLLTTIAASRPGEIQYALEGSVFVAGAAIQWLRDELGVIPSAKECQTLAESIEDTAGGYVVPAFTGLGAPYWNQRARGTIVGITRGFTRAHLVRATLESLAYQTYDIARAMEEDANISLSGLRVDGGAAANNFLMQFQADLLGCSIRRPQSVETTALGAAYLAGLATGFWSGLDEIRANDRPDRDFAPSALAGARQALLPGWHRAVKAALAFAEE